MLDAMFIGALILGAFVWRLGLPPLVGFLFSGFLFGALGAESNELLEEISHAGVLLLLFAVGLKLRLKTLFQPEVWGTAVVHTALVALAAGALLAAAVDYPTGIIAMLAVTFSFSSTVLAAKSLDTQHELRAAHGRVAIGILIVQDLTVAIRVRAAARAACASSLVLAARLRRPRRAARPVRCGCGNRHGRGGLRAAGFELGARCARARRAAREPSARGGAQ
jgi:predicted Kef-type K+ transport protein